MYHIDVKHMLLNSSRMRNFKQKSDNLWNASCPVCGDSSSNTRKARLYFFRHGNSILVKCHNCQYSASFSKFLQYLDPIQHKDYTYEKYLANRPFDVEPVIPAELAVKEEIRSYRTAQELTIPSIGDLVAGHPARAYIASRLIPEQYWSELYFADGYKDFLDRDFPDHGKEDLPNDQRIVIPLINQDNYVTYLTGRDLAARSKIRYVTVKIIEEQKVYGFNRLQDAPGYITEGPFDSLFLPNAVAAADANLIGCADFLWKRGFKKMTLVYDNQPRNSQICAQMEKAIGLGHRVTILTYSDESKDINDLVLSGWSLERIQNLIDEYSFQGHRALLEFTRWRRS